MARKASDDRRRVWHLSQTHVQRGSLTRCVSAPRADLPLPDGATGFAVGERPASPVGREAGDEF